MPSRLTMVLRGGGLFPLLTAPTMATTGKALRTLLSQFVVAHMCCPHRPRPHRRRLALCALASPRRRLSPLASSMTYSAACRTMASATAPKRCSRWPSAAGAPTEGHRPTPTTSL